MEENTSEEAEAQAAPDQPHAEGEPGSPSAAPPPLAERERDDAFEELRERIEALEGAAREQQERRTSAAADHAQLGTGLAGLADDQARLTAELARHAESIARLEQWAKEHRGP